MVLARQPWFVGILLFASGLSALVYQTTWFREFRLVFGTSTYATAAVLAIFMAGLGLGSAVLGRVADRKRAPLAWYGQLELGIAASAALSLLLIVLARKIYISLGGVVSLGLPGATVARIVLSIIVLGLPTFLMGGTLPAAARAVENDADSGRRRLALLYGMNTLGAVAGALLSTFVLLETLGNRKTLLLAALLNVLVAIVAIALARPVATGETAQPGGEPVATPRRRFATPVLVAAAIVGFAFFLLELVWYRMLTPLLGGTTFTFGLILATALLGIGLGGAAYAFWSGPRAATPGTFAVTCCVEAIAVIVPFALGDRLAIFANLLQTLDTIGFAGEVLAWSIITASVVFPAAFVSGIQFPILVALLGRGRTEVGRDVGAAYAWNTGGAIAGSLAGGFGLLPLLSAPGAWRLSAVLLALLGGAAALTSLRRRGYVTALAAIALGATAIALTTMPGPTAVWRHTGIGAGRAEIPGDAADLRDWMNTARRTIRWEADGRESSIAVADWDDRNFSVNGKVDGSARGDDSTQIMSGLLGAMLHRDPRRSLVVGLGTGSTAGWLAAVPSMQRVDVVELEPAVRRVAQDFAAVNAGCMSNPKVRIHINDAREVLLTTPERYDIIFSEPSNPYRAGIASLYTKEFYEAAAARLERGGLFIQWVQAYEIDTETVRTIYSTITSVFKQVDTWRTTPSDLILVASREPWTLDLARLDQRLSTSPYYEAAHYTWRVETVEGVLSHFIGNDMLSRTIGDGKVLNTDDRTVIEFGFARTLGGDEGFDVNELIHAARALGADRPPRISGNPDWSLVDLNRWTYAALELPPTGASDLARARHEFTKLYDDEDLAGALEKWREARWGPVNSLEVSRIAEVLAEDGSDEADVFLMLLRDLQPIEAKAIEARLELTQGNQDDAARLVSEALEGYRSNPWPLPAVMGRAITLAAALAGSDRDFAKAMLDATSRPFAAGQLEEQRLRQRVNIAWGTELGCGPNTVAALRALEPHVPWTEAHLRMRRRCYAKADLHDLYRKADADWDEFQSTQRKPLIER
ncbi:MAG: fused MFS/spermidine synthase [Thermoanaerobaculia bacterium]